MSSYQCARSEDAPEFFTRDGLATDFGISPRTIEKYIENGHVPPALGKHPSGLNYNHTHYQALKRIYAELAPVKNRRSLRQRTHHHAHIIVRCEHGPKALEA